MIGYTSIAVFIFSAIALIIPSGFSVGAAMLLLGAVVLFKRNGKLQLDREDRLLIWVLLFYFVVSVAANLFHHEVLKEYDLPLRFLLAVPALLLLRAYPPSPACFWGGLAVGGILAGIFTGWQNLFLGQDRAGGHTNPIQYGNISFIIGMLCLAGFSWAQFQSRKLFWTVFLIVGALMGLLGSLFAGSRGSWVGLPLCLIVLFMYYGGTFNKRYVFGGITALILFFGIIYATPRTEVKARAEMAVKETQDYFKHKNAVTNVGVRFEMWRAAILVIPERPWLGWGKAGFVERESALIKAGTINAFMQDNNHVYNEWLDAQVKHGVPGLLALLALYFIPLALFGRRFRQKNDRSAPYAVAGILLIISYFGFGWTQVFLAHNTGVMILGFMLVILWGLLKAEERPFA